MRQRKRSSDLARKKRLDNRKSERRGAAPKPTAALSSSKKLSKTHRRTIKTNQDGNGSGSVFKKRAITALSSILVSTSLFTVAATPAQAFGLIDALKFLKEAHETMTGFFAAGSMSAMAGDLSNAVVMQNHSKSAERLASTIQSITQVDALKGVVTSLDSTNIPDSMKCTALYNNKYSLFQNMLSQQYTYLQMSAAATEYTTTPSEAREKNIRRNMEDYCSIDETAMGFCTFTPDGTDALSQDYSVIFDNVRMDPIAATAASDLANNLVLISQTDYAQQCDSVDCKRIRDTERQFTALASIVHASVLGQVNASQPLEYEPLRDYVNENLGIGGGAPSGSTIPDPADSDAVKGGLLTDNKIDESAHDVSGKNQEKPSTESSDKK